MTWRIAPETGASRLQTDEFKASVYKYGKMFNFVVYDHSPDRRHKDRVEGKARSLENGKRIVEKLIRRRKRTGHW